MKDLAGTITNSLFMSISRMQQIRVSTIVVPTKALSSSWKKIPPPQAKIPYQSQITQMDMVLETYYFCFYFLCLMSMLYLQHSVMSCVSHPLQILVDSPSTCSPCCLTMTDTESDTLFIKHLPQELTDEEKEELLRYVGATYITLHEQERSSEAHSLCHLP